MTASLIANSFVLVFTLCNVKILNEPAVIFLTTLVICNLAMSVLYLIPVTITTAVGEWVFGETDEQKTGSCQFIGYLYSQNVYLISFIFTIISVDRFLFIVKPLIHKRFMKTRTAVMTVIIAWLLSIVLSSIPFMFGLSEQYKFDGYTGTCGSSFESQIDYEVVFVFVVLVCIAIIAVTSTWTFCFTRRFIKRLSRPDLEANSSSAYNSQVRKVFGIFSALLLATIVTYVPGIVTAMIGIALGSGSPPGILISIIHILFYLNYVLIPLIQLYFRRELNYYITILCVSVRCCRSTSSKVQPQVAATGAVSTEAEQID